MPETNPASSVIVTQLANGVRIDIDRTVKKPLPAASIIFLAFFAVGFLSLGLWLIFVIVPRNSAKDMFDEIGMGLVILIGLIPTLVGLFMGLALTYSLAGRDRVEVRAGRIRYIKNLAFFHWTSARPIDQVQNLEVRIGASNRNAPAGPQTRSDILVNCRGEASALRIVSGYPAAIAQLVANELNRRLNQPATSSNSVSIPTVVRENAWLQHSPGESIPQPEKSEIVIDRKPESLTLTIPSDGFGLNSFGGVLLYVWFLASLLILPFALSLVSSPHAKSVMAILSAMISLLLLLIVIDMGQQKTMFTATSSTLQIIRSSLFRKRRWKWTNQEIVGIYAVQVVAKNSSANWSELRIQLRTGSKWMVAGNADDVQWMAFEIRQALSSVQPAATKVG